MELDERFPTLTFHDLTGNGGREAFLAWFDAEFPADDQGAPPARIVIETVLDRDRYDCAAAIVESQYTDRDYSDAHTWTYSTSGRPREATRIHFFNVRVASANLEGADDTLSDAYIGFCVIWPVPRAIAGRTLLSPPPKLDAHFRTAEFEVDLAGIRLTVACAPFAQKDRVVASCASAALWVSTHLLAQRYRYTSFTIPKITRIGLGLNEDIVSGDAVQLPIGQGLNAEQMETVFASCDLESLHVDEGWGQHLGSVVSSLTISGTPPVLSFDSQWSGEPNSRGLPKSEWAELDGTNLDRHAVTLVGVTIAEPDTNQKQLTPFPRQVSAIWVHDDRGIPYRRARLVQDTESAAGASSIELLTDDGSEVIQTGISIAAVSPLPRRLVIRNPIEAHVRAKRTLDSLRAKSELARERTGQSVDERTGLLTTRLWAATDFKRSLRALNPGVETALRIAGASMSRWVWVTTLHTAADQIEELVIFDAREGLSHFTVAFVAGDLCVTPPGNRDAVVEAIRTGMLGGVAHPKTLSLSLFD